MITDEEVLVWIKGIFKADKYYCGILNSKPQKSIGIYSLKQNKEKAIGGDVATITKSHKASFLLHWNESTRESQNKAIELYNAIENSRCNQIGKHTLNYIQMLQNAPVFLKQDENGIVEYVIEVCMWYQN